MGLCFTTSTAGINALVNGLQEHGFKPLRGEPQDRRRQIRYARARDFADEVAAEFMERVRRESSIHSL